METVVFQGLGESVWGKLSDAPLSIARSWNTKLPPEHIRTVESIVHDSPIMAWWGEE